MRRIGAARIDVVWIFINTLVVMGLFWVCTWTLEGFSLSTARYFNLVYYTMMLSSLSTFLLYSTICDSVFKGRSIGKKCMHLVAKNQDQTTIGVAKALVRAVFKLFFLFAYLIAIVFLLVNKRHQLPYDLLLKTEVTDG